MGWKLLDLDRELFERELQTFVPSRVFDAHAHLCERSYFGDDPPKFLLGGPEYIGMSAYQAHIADILPQRKTSGLFFGHPFEKGDAIANNQLVAREVALDPNSRAQMLIRPEMDPEYIRETVRRYRFVGLKCYHVYAAERPTPNAQIPSYLPEEHVRIAHEEGLSITIHIVRPRALADQSNQEVIRCYAERYPNTRFILAHAGRCFNPYHAVEGIEAFRNLSNVWFDTSAVTEAGAFEAIARTMGVHRLLYGSDFPVTHIRGRCVAVGDSFLWLDTQNTDFSAEYADVKPSLVGIESLRALRLACLNLRLTDAEVEAIFYTNSSQLFGLLA